MAVFKYGNTFLRKSAQKQPTPIIRLPLHGYVKSFFCPGVHVTDRHSWPVGGLGATDKRGAAAMEVAYVLGPCLIRDSRRLRSGGLTDGATVKIDRTACRVLGFPG